MRSLSFAATLHGRIHSGGGSEFGRGGGMRGELTEDKETRREEGKEKTGEEMKGEWRKWEKRVRGEKLHG